MVRSELTQSYVPLRQETFLDPSMAETMEGVEGGVVAHRLDPVLEPLVEFIAKDRFETTLVVGDLEDRSVTEAPVPSVNVDERENGPDRTQEGIVGRSQRDLVDPFAKLVVFGFLDREKDSAVHVVVERLDVLPTEDHFQIDGLARLRDQVTAPEHGQEIQDAERFIDGECLVIHNRGVWRNLGKEKTFQDGWGNREGLFNPVLGQPSRALEDEIEGTVLRGSGYFADVQHPTHSPYGADVLGQGSLGFYPPSREEPLGEKADIVIFDRQVCDTCQRAVKLERLPLRS